MRRAPVMIVLVAIAVVVAVVVYRLHEKHSPRGGEGAGGDTEGIGMLDRAFRPGCSFRQDDTVLTFHTREIGNLRVVSGRLVAVDAFIPGDGEAFARNVPLGEYPVEISIGRRGTDERIAFARVRFSNKKAVRWEKALTPSESRAALRQNQEPGYGVDSGTGSFMDELAARELERRLGSDGSYLNRLYDEMNKTYRNTRCWALLDLGATNVAMFSSGDGDGCYPSYWGFDADGAVVTLTTDFYVIFWDR